MYISDFYQKCGVCLKPSLKFRLRIYIHDKTWCRFVLGSSVLYQSEIDPLSPCNSTPSLNGFSPLQTASGLSAGRKPMILSQFLQCEKKKIHSDSCWQL